MSNPELGSIEFFEKYYPKTKPQTRAIYSRLISNLESWLEVHPSDYGGWLEDKKSNLHRWKERFLFLRKFNGIYWNIDIGKHNSDYLKLVQKVTLGENVCVKPSNESDTLIAEFERLDSLITLKRLEFVEYGSIFGAFLPPRRLDVYSLMIRDSDTDETINYYNKTTNNFVFRDSKTIKDGNSQTIGILTLLPLYDDKTVLFRAIEWLNSRPIGPLFPWVKFDKHITKWYGCTNTTLRKYWGTKFTNNGTKQQKIILSQWMGHTIDQCVKSYTIEPTQPQPEPSRSPSLVTHCESLPDLTDDWVPIEEPVITRPQIPHRHPKRIIKTVYEYIYE